MGILFKFRYATSLILALIGFGGESAYEQQPRPDDWPVTLGRQWLYSPMYNETRVQEGYIVLKSGDTLNGHMKVLPYSHGIFTAIPLLPPGGSTTYDVRSVTREKISSIRVYGNSSETGNDFTDFFNLGDNHELWRLLARKNELGIYDDYSSCFGHPFGEEMIIAANGKRIVIYKNTFHREDVLPALLRFMNKRYKTHFTAHSFENKNAIFNYILEKENSPNSSRVILTLLTMIR